MDWNSHMANTAYLNKVVDARVLALADKGFPLDEFIRLRLGVVIMKDELEYKRDPRTGVRGSPVSHRCQPVGAGTRIKWPITSCQGLQRSCRP